MLIAEMTNRNVRYARDIEAASGAPVLAVVPSVKRCAARRDAA